MTCIDRIVVVIRKTDLEELVERFNSRAQARFYVEHMGVDFSEYEDAHEVYKNAIARLVGLLPRKTKHHVFERSFLPTYSFRERDLVVTLGPDGLVINAAKYLSDQPIIALNPDPTRIDGILNPLTVEEFPRALESVLTDRSSIARLTMAAAQLNDGQRLFAVNDLFIGHRSHGTARYDLEVDKTVETQASSGLIVSTGVGSTGWQRSILMGAAGIVGAVSGHTVELPFGDGRFDWERDELRFFVREPFPSKISTCRTVCGQIGPGCSISITSRMPENGVIFSDGIEADYIPFKAGAVAKIELATRKAVLVLKNW